MLAISTKITIGNKEITGLCGVNIKRSIHTLGSTATIKLPVRGVVREDDKPLRYVSIADEIGFHEKVTIELGYNGNLHKEFTGYVTTVSQKDKVEICCEDAFCKVRKLNVTLDGSENLHEILVKCGLVPLLVLGVRLKNFVADNEPVSSVLSRLKDQYNLCIFFDADEKVWACTSAALIGSRVNYRLGWNVLSDTDLKNDGASKLVRIHAVSTLKDGTPLEAFAGPGAGVLKTVRFPNVSDPVQLRALAEAKLVSQLTGGYHGKMTTLLEPFAEPADTAVIDDPQNLGRTGEYLIESTEVRLDDNGMRRIIEIKPKELKL